MDTRLLSGLSWSGFQLYGDEKSIKEVQRLMFEAERAKELQGRLEEVLR